MITPAHHPWRTLTIALWLCGTLAAPSRGADATLAALKETYEKAQQPIVTRQAQAAARAAESYGKAIGEAATALKQEGDLDGYVLLGKEAQRFESENSIPEGGVPPLHAVIAKARTAYRLAIKRANARSNALQLQLVDRYLPRLHALQREMTSSDRIDDALKAKDEIRRMEFVRAELQSRTVLNPEKEQAPKEVAAREPLPEPSDHDEKDEVVIPVTSDKSIVRAGSETHDQYYWVETDQSRGRVELTFSDRRLSAMARPEAVTLRVFVPDVTNAQSKDYVDVFYVSKKVGSFKGGSPNTWIDVPLDSSLLSKRSSRWTLQLTPAGPDGLAIATKKSGNGAELRLAY